MVTRWEARFSWAVEMPVTALENVSTRIVNGVSRTRDTTAKISPRGLGAAERKSTDHVKARPGAGAGFAPGLAVVCRTALAGHGASAP
jgi:hypothetical protein